MALMQNISLLQFIASFAHTCRCSFHGELAKPSYHFEEAPFAWVGFKMILTSNKRESALDSPLPATT
jgi:hypothetical protein